MLANLLAIFALWRKIDRKAPDGTSKAQVEEIRADVKALNKAREELARDIALLQQSKAVLEKDIANVRRNVHNLRNQLNKAKIINGWGEDDGGSE